MNRWKVGFTLCVEKFEEDWWLGELTDQHGYSIVCGARTQERVIELVVRKLYKPGWFDNIKELDSPQSACSNDTRVEN